MASFLSTFAVPVCLCRRIAARNFHRPIFFCLHSLVSVFILEFLLEDLVKKLLVVVCFLFNLTVGLCSEFWVTGYIKMLRPEKDTGTT